MASSVIPFPVHSSVLRGDALADWLLESYALAPPVTCGLLVRGEHDNYLVTTGDGTRLMLRVHAHDTTELSLAAVEEQASVMAALRRAGVAVEAPIVRRDGCTARSTPSARWQRARAWTWATCWMSRCAICWRCRGRVARSTPI